MNAVLISSESRMLIKEQIDEIISSSQNIINYDLDNCSIEDIINEASYINLIEEQKYIIVKNCNIFSSAKMKKEEEKQKNTDSDRGGAWRRPCRCLVF